jgi:GNAT superfamily N-acetyltransferase
MDKNDVHFEIASAGDSNRITSLVNSVYRGENSKKGWTTEADFLEGIRITEEKIKEIIQSEKDIIILALEDQKLTGCVHLENARQYSYLGMLSVDVNCQDKGIGKILITECERYTKEVFRLNEIRMKVISRRTELIEYYKRRGYLLTGEKESFDSTEGTFGTPKEKLYFITLVKNL